MKDQMLLGVNQEVKKPVLFKLTIKNANPATEGRYYPGIKRIPSEDVIFDSATGTSKPIRYSVNEESIFKSDQPAHVELTDVIFTNGSLRVYEDNPTLLKYLRLCNWNKGNPSKVRGKRVLFYEYNPELVAAEKIENEMLEIDARHTAKHMEFSELSTLARALGMNINRTSSEIRFDMMLFAKNKPRDFMDSLDNPVLKRRSEVLEAIELGILKRETRAFYLKETLGDVSLVVIPLGEDPTEYFVNWTLNVKEGEEGWKKVEKKRKKMLG